MKEIKIRIWSSMKIRAFLWPLIRFVWVSWIAKYFNQKQLNVKYNPKWCTNDDIKTSPMITTRKALENDKISEIYQSIVLCVYSQKWMNLYTNNDHFWDAFAFANLWVNVDGLWQPWAKTQCKLLRNENAMIVRSLVDR